MKRTRAAGRLLRAIWLLSIVCMLLSGCRTAESESITSIRQLDGQTIGVMTGSTFDQHTDTYINDAKKEYYTTYADMALAVEQGKIAAFLMDEPLGEVNFFSWREKVDPQVVLKDGSSIPLHPDRGYALDQSNTSCQEDWNLERSVSLDEVEHLLLIDGTVLYPAG